MSTVGQISNGESGLSARTKLNLVIDRTTVFDTSANFTSNNPTLNTGQIGVETDDLLTVPKFKIGDGVNDWNTLPYANIIIPTKHKETFTYSGSPLTMANSCSFMYSLNWGNLSLNEGVDYSFSGTTLTILNTNINNGDLLYATYE